MSAGGDQRQQQLLLEEQQAMELEAVGEADGLPLQQQQIVGSGAGVPPSEVAAAAAPAAAPAAGETQGGLPNGGAADVMDVERVVAAKAVVETATETRPSAVGKGSGANANGGLAQKESQEGSGGRVEETKGGEGSVYHKVVTVTTNGAGGPGPGVETREEAEVSKVRPIVFREKRTSPVMLSDTKSGSSMLVGGSSLLTACNAAAVMRRAGVATVISAPLRAQPLFGTFVIAGRLTP